MINEDMFLGSPDFIPPSVACFGNKYIKRWQASTTKYLTYNYWRQLFYTAAITRFKWVGLPDGIDPRYLEVLLYGWGSFAATRRGESEVLPFWCGRMSPVGNKDLYNNPNKLDILSPNGFIQRRHANTWVDHRGSNQHANLRKVCPPNAVICWDNLSRMPLMHMIDIQASRLAEMDATVDQHARALRVPYVIAVSEGGEKNAQELYNKIAAGEPAIYQYGFNQTGLPIQTLQTMTSAGYAGDKLLNDELKIVAAVYTALGIDNNAAAEKKERVQTAETLANNEQFILQRASFMRCRQDFLDRCVEVLGEAWAEAKIIWDAPHPAEGAGSGSGNGEGDGEGLLSSAALFNPQEIEGV